MSKMYIVSAGAVTGLGFDLPASAAAMNARLDNFKETNFIDSVNENYVGSYIPTELLEKDYPANGVAKLRLLLKQAVLESLARLGYGDDKSTTKNVPYHKWSIIFVLSEEHSSQVDRLSTLLKDISILASASFLEVAIGSAGIGIAINTAKTWLNEKKADAVIIVSMDTWLEPSLISLGARSSRLLDSENGIGCIPAEAAVAVVLSNNPPTTQSPVSVAGLGIGQEPVMLKNTDKPTMGRGLRDAYRQALSSAGIKMTDLHLRIGDVTGEEYFFEESINGYGAVLEGVMPEGYKALLTSSYLGDVKSASGLFSMAYVWQLAQSGQFNDKYAVMHMSSPTHSERAVVILQVGKHLDKPLIISKVILPAVVQQHIEEASLYWLRQQDASWHPAITQNDAQIFEKAMNDHLYGLLIAGESGLNIALKQMEQWKTADEVFVALYAFLNATERDIRNLERIQIVLDQDEMSFQGATAAISNTPTHLNEILIDKWWHHGTIQQRSVLIPVLRQYPQIFTYESIMYALQRAYMPIRKQALRLVGELLLKDYKNELHLAFLNENDKSCKLEAACSLALMKDYEAINSFAATDLIDTHASLRQFMIWSHVVSVERFEQWVSYAKQNAHIWALLWSIFFRSNSKYLNEVIEILKNDNNHAFTRLSSYVIGHLTGVDIDNLDLWIKDEMISNEKYENLALSEDNAPNDYWGHKQQYDLMQSGLLYPNKEALLEKLTGIKTGSDELVINGKPLATFNEEDLSTYSFPKIRIINLYRRLSIIL